MNRKSNNAFLKSRFQLHTLQELSANLNSLLQQKEVYLDQLCFI